MAITEYIISLNKYKKLTKHAILYPNFLVWVKSQSLKKSRLLVFIFAHQIIFGLLGFRSLLILYFFLFVIILLQIQFSVFILLAFFESQNTQSKSECYKLAQNSRRKSFPCQSQYLSVPI